jgi:iron-sulfur cluster repair protein YtfE (RIC family)
MLAAESEPETVTQYLRQDHDRIDILIADLCAMVEDGELERADYSAGDLDAALRRHIRLEEDLLFPLFDERIGIRGPTIVMRDEHRQIEGWLGALERALADGSRAHASTALAELLQILGRHNRKEENILYPKTDSALRPDERRALVARMRAS